MKPKKNIRHMTHRTNETGPRAAIKSALLWGTVYSTATTGTAVAVATGMDLSTTMPLQHIVTGTMVMFYPFGAVRGLTMWYAREGRERMERKKSLRYRRAARHHVHVHSHHD